MNDQGKCRVDGGVLEHFLLAPGCTAIVLPSGARLQQLGEERAWYLVEPYVEERPAGGLIRRSAAQRLTRLSAR